MPIVRPSANRIRRASSSFATLGLIWCLASAGCGGARAPDGATLAGEVTIDGEPVAEGAITWTPRDASAGQAVGASIADGRYQVDGVPWGEVTVTFQAVRETGRTIQEYSKQVPETVNIIPPQYGGGIVVMVEKGQSTQDFALTTK